MNENNKYTPRPTPPLGGWGVLLFFIGLLLFFFLYNPTRSFQPSVPGMDNRGKGVAASIAINIGEFFERISDKETDLKESWPRFRGADFDNIYKTPGKLASSLKGKAGEILWSKELGEGHAGAAIYQGKVYLLDYNEDERADVLHCYDLQTGDELWKRWYKVPIKRNHGMSRTFFFFLL